MQKLQPLQAKITARYPDKADEQKKNQLLSQLFQAADINPLAGCFPALVQIPIFISLYRALQNLIAENKLNEPFLWIPDLEGPVYSSSATKSTDWFYSIFSGTLHTLQTYPIPALALVLMNSHVQQGILIWAGMIPRHS